MEARPLSSLIVREAIPDDAEVLFSLIRETQRETPHLLLEPGEGIASPSEQRRALEVADGRVVLMAFLADRPVCRASARVDPLTSGKLTPSTGC